MNMLKSFLSFWYNFIVGDDWLLAAGVIVGLCVTALTIRQNYWWMLPIVVLGALVASLFKTTSPRD